MSNVVFKKEWPWLGGKKESQKAKKSQQAVNRG